VGRGAGVKGGGVGSLWNAKRKVGRGMGVVCQRGLTNSCNDLVNLAPKCLVLFINWQSLEANKTAVGLCQLNYKLVKG
jgi:hypothetical protein